MNGIKKISHPDRSFFVLTAYWFIFISIIGFGMTAILRDYSKVSTYLILHGISFTTWMFIYLTQCYLISNKKIKWHMLLGKISMVILVIILITTYGTVVWKMSEGRKSFEEAAGNIIGITIGFIVTWVAVYFRKQPYKHKRVMLTAMVFLTGAAVQRACGFLGLGATGIAVIIMSIIPLVSLVIYDLLLFRKLKKLGVILLLIALIINISGVSYTFLDNDLGRTLIEVMMNLFIGTTS